MIDKNREIEEMVIALSESQHEFDKAWHECLHNNGKRPERENVFYAKYLIENKGYRKQREGENISQMHPSDEFICEKCGLIIRDCCRYEIDPDDGDEICYEFPYQFCPRCGMKVKGE